MFYVAGYPVKLFAENVGQTDGLALIPILNQNIIEFYPVAEIPAGTYTWQNEAVNTVAVKAVLISFDFRRSHCDNVGRFAQILRENLDWLRANGHPKWKTVDLEYPLKGWKQYDCVQKYIGTSRPIQPKRASEINPVLDAVKELLK